MDEIKNMDHVVDVWSPKDKQIDIIVETNAKNNEQIDVLKGQINQLEGVFKIIPRISAEIDS